MTHDRRRAAPADSGLTLIELLVVVVLMGLVVTVISAAFVTILRAAPPAQFRIDDARSTRGLQTWLARDIASTPPNATIVALEGGFIFSGVEPSLTERCGVATGSNVLHLTWTDRDLSPETYHANYRLMPSGSTNKVVRSLCSTSSPTPATVTLTSGVSSMPCASRPFSKKNPTAGTDVESVELCFVGEEGDTGLNAGGGRSREIVLTVSSRNLVEVFTP
jgi:prepilin-type N-terminal cleavage/methylation domain-containing protein